MTDQRPCRLAGLLTAVRTLGLSGFFAAVQLHGALAEETQLVASETVTVVADRRDLLGSAVTSSQGVVVDEELKLTPAFRAGQLLETVPGLAVTTHSGEGKANQYLLRGFSLDHGTDLAISVDGMPVNERTHAHGQGYADLNFLIPELATGAHFTKGPYFAAKGDFAAVGSVDLSYRSDVRDQVAVTTGSQGFQRLLAMGTRDLANGSLLGAVELQHFDGPWNDPDDQRKLNAVVRFTSGNDGDGYAISAMYYGGLWNATTDQPLRAVTSGQIGRFGSLDPSDGGWAERYSLSGQYAEPIGAGQFTANLYAIGNRLTLWNNFTHFLMDPVHGDQEAQQENRQTFGGSGSYEWSQAFFGFETDVTAGLDTRLDRNNLGHAHTQNRQFLNLTDADRVQEYSVGGYVQATTQWTDWLRSVLGLREDYFTATDDGSNSGQAAQDLFQPKASLIATVSSGTELYISAGRGFHSDDVRGVTQAARQGLGGAPLLARAEGWEFGIREALLPNLSFTVTGFAESFQSELTYDPDIGETDAGPPSRRTGVELNVTYQALSWLELYGSFAASHARYSEDSDDREGAHIGRHIPNAPASIATVQAYFHDAGPWSGSLEYRYLGAYPLTPDAAVMAAGYGEWNAEVGYALGGGLVMRGGLYNIFNTTANAAEYWYADRLAGEPAQGMSDVHAHPLEPVSVRVTLKKSF